MTTAFRKEGIIAMLRKPLRCATAIVSAGSFAVCSQIALAQEESSGITSAWTSYVMLRSEFSEQRLNKKIPAAEVASQTALLDLNLTGKTEFSPLLRLQADVDVFARKSWNFKQRNIQTGAVQNTSKGSDDNPAYRLALNELYVNGEPTTGFQYTAGKKRVLWGTGFAANPTDLLNPAKNPLDPTYERRGAWLLQGEYVQEKQTFALVFAPEVLEDKNTLPTDVGVLRDPDGARRMHSLTGLRWYSLVGEADVNLIAYYSNRFKNQKASALSGGASWSQIATAISKQLETHAEVIVRQGSDRPLPDGTSRLESDDVFFRSLVGMRYDFDNESSLVFEYLYQSDGDSVDDLQSRLQRGFAAARLSRSATVALPAQIAMRNTLFLNYQRYKINDDAFLSWAIAHNPHDHSGFQGPVFQWTPSQSVAVTLSASSDYNLVKEFGAEIPGIGRVRGNELNPVKSRLGLEVKAYY